MPGLEAIKGLGIFDLKSGLALLISSVPSISATRKMGGEIDKENLKDAMKWDLWNPWAKYYELNSTHPLLANRIINLSKHSEFLGKKSFVRFDERRPESYWDEFIVDIFIDLLPLLVIIGFAISFLFTHDYYLISIGIIALGFASLLNTRFSYKLDFFPEMLISGLLKKVKVSYIRSVPCKIKGTIIGRGVPGLIWSEDFIMQDETGIIFLDYSQPIPLWDLFFGILRGAEYNNQEAEVTGWFRRAPVPYIEVKTIRAKREKEIKCYTYIAKYIWAGILIIIGLIGLFLTSLIL